MSSTLSFVQLFLSAACCLNVWHGEAFPARGPVEVSVDPCKTVVLIGSFCMLGLVSRTVWPSARSLATKMAGWAPYESGTHSVAFVTVPDEDTGKKLARALVEQKLAACVNIIPKLTSIYEWEGKIEEDGESMMVIKTRASRVDDISDFIRKNHLNEVAEVISMPIENGNLPYLEWLGGIVQPKKS